MSSKTRKVIDISDGDMQFVCIKVAGEEKAYRLYKVWWDMGKHKRLIGKYDSIDSTLEALPTLRTRTMTFEMAKRMIADDHYRINIDVCAKSGTIGQEKIDIICGSYGEIRVSEMYGKMDIYNICTEDGTLTFYAMISQSDIVPEKEYWDY